ncbi:prolyl aminopeptidase [Thalassomonas sp. RHCl1]|uniref:prolyl aminopeptidase n=1 Tax=Thalassomonas sp. RHCl1 TaxID=2995320 RepID=UPI00248BFB6A|nr:prolyl aminopeptidase [Thalassomonas sp. RHCl1]
MNDFYPEIEPYQHFMLDVDHGHQLYVEQCGNPAGQPVIFIHGGPGAGCSTNDRRFFDPEKYRIILFDQRGCGRSLPHGSLEENTTSALVADIERIRQHLEITKWHVFGGSWGSTLSLVYAQHHPQQVTSLVLRGIFLARQQDTDWTFSGGGAKRIYPDHWQAYLNAFPHKEGEGESQADIHGAYQLMTGPDKALAEKIARAWATWEMSCCTLAPDQAFLKEATTDKRCWSLARHEAHYMVNNCFLDENQILDNCDKLRDIPTIIVHGRYDIVCPLDNAWLLHQKLPQSQLLISEQSGHASVETNTKHHLIAATRQMLNLG